MGGHPITRLHFSSGAVNLAVIVILAVSVGAQTPADLILVNANIRTLDPKKPRAEAIAVAGERIIAVGTNAEIRKRAWKGTRVIDAKGRLVIPGFNDAHVHLAGIGNLFSHLDVTGSNRAEMLDEIARFVSFLPESRWLLGRGWSKSRSDLPTLDELDRISVRNPLLVYSDDFTAALANSAAHRLAGFSTRNSLVDGNELDRIRRLVRLDHTREWPAVVETASNYAASLGVTSVQDVHSDDLAEVLRSLDAAGKLKTRVYECIGIGERNKSIAAGLKAATGTPMVRTGCVKGMATGEPDELDELRSHISEADRAGLQVMIHAIGTRSIENTLVAFEHAAATNGRRDRRFRIEHAARMPAGLWPRLSKNSVIASMQPFLFYSGPTAGDDYKGLLSAGVTLAFGSDASITDFDPLLAIHSAVNGGERSITVEQAVAAHTVGSAYAEFQEKEKGSIEAGKLADLVMLSQDIFTIDPRRIGETKVTMTILGGRVVFQRE